jgi:O-antigen/teichoic acid export membrane protein
MIFRNTVAQTAAYVTGYVLSFVLAPIMLAQLGLELFGVWAVTGAIATYAGLADLGIARSMERFVAVFHAARDRRKLRECFTFGLIGATVASASAVLAAVFLAPVIDRALDDPLGREDMRAVLIATAIAFGSHTFRSVINSVPEGMQRMVPPAIATIVYAVVSFAVGVAALLISRDLVTYAWANAGAAVLGVAIAFVSLRGVWTDVALRRPSRALVKEILGFSIRSQAGVVADLVNQQTDKVLIALLIGVRAAGAYEIANRAVLAVRTVGMMGTAAILSAATTRIAVEGRGVISAFYAYYTSRATAVTMPVVVGTAVAAPALLVAWIGDVPEDSVAVFIALTLANAVNLTTGVSSNIMLAEGRPGVVSLYAGLAAGLNILLTVILAPLFELWGVIGATVIALVASSAIFTMHFHRNHGINWRVYAIAVGQPLLLSLAAAAPGIAWLLIQGAPNDRLSALPVCAGIGLVFTAIYWVGASRLAILPVRLTLSRLRPAPSVPV